MSSLSSLLFWCELDEWLTDPGPLRDGPAGVGARLCITRSSIVRSQRPVTSLISRRVSTVTRTPDVSTLRAVSTAPLPRALQPHGTLTRLVVKSSKVQVQVHQKSDSSAGPGLESHNSVALECLDHSSHLNSSHLTSFHPN